MTLARQLVVSNSGTIHRIGSPQEVYIQSHDVVLAEFVGHVGETTSLVVAARRAHLFESCPGLRPQRASEP